jgi:outer membrane protein assembly factor BamB
MNRSINFTTTILFLFATGVAPQGSIAEDAHWPGWLGPHRDGWVGDVQPPAKWPETLKREWQIEVGTGYGTPLVSGNRIYVHTRQDEDEVLTCVDLNTGQVQWRKRDAVPFKMGGGGEWHGKGPKSSPVMAEGRIFTMSITGTLSAWDVESGDRLWQRNYDSQFGKSQPYWGASTSPIVAGNRVIVHFGTDEKGALVALDVETGEEIWTQGKDGASYSSPLLVEIDGVRQIVEWNHQSLAGVDSQAGQLLWEHPFPHDGSNQNMPTPTFYHDGQHARILLGAENRGIHSFQPQLKDGKWTVTKNWSQKSVALDMSSAVINGEYLFGFSHYKQGQLFCLDPKTGEVLWESPGRTGQNVMFLAIPNHIIALLDNGHLQVLAAKHDSYQKLADYQVSEKTTWAPPVLLKNGLLIKDEKMLTLWSLNNE